MSKSECKKEYLRRIHKVQDYIEEHIGETLSIEKLADVAGFSKYHFSRIFQGMLQEPLAHYVNRIRMERALFLLAHRADKNMTDIAYELGFMDSAVFSRSFKNYHGISPKEYRQEYSKNCKETFLLSEYNKVTAKKEWEGNPFPVTVEITIENTGFGAFYQDGELILEMENYLGEISWISIGQIKGWKSGETRTYSGQIKKEKGKLFLWANRCGDNRLIRFANETDQNGRVLLGTFVG